MRGFLAGLCLGGLIGAGVFWVLQEDRGAIESMAAPEEPARPEPREAAPILRAAPAPTPPEVSEPEPQPTVPSGALVLRIGEGLQLATGTVLRGEQVKSADVVCEDIYRVSGAVLGCPHGCAMAQRPPEYQRYRIDILRAYELADEAMVAPESLDKTRLGLVVRAERQLGFGFARDAQGRAYRIEALDTTSEPIALNRRVHLRVVPVELGTEDDRYALPSLEHVSLREGVKQQIETALEAARAMPGGFGLAGRNLVRGGLGVDEVPLGIRMRGHRGLAFSRAVAIPVEVKGHASVLALGGTGPRAEIALQHHSGLYVAGDVEGKIKVEDHSMLLVEGDVLGSVIVGNHAIVRIQGDVRGDLTILSNARVLLLGDWNRRLDLSRCSHSHLYFDTHLNRADIERLPKPGNGTTLHIPASDLGAGKHTGVHGFHEVIVGEDLWPRLRD